ncbi:guanitoxin biosynthesis MBL fold metallo-hydrolase GntH [Tropicimonas marinistellae]|uniref:guanitoxin biosynthesis MBL fold metallo-hydrolase GntH n=1 Tax=Tropicimonas marinistellae TaxID=1739787 RepID=UPI000A99563F|nr:guanitoxin biosynthesis MBL fold metallo-hydrolase GntH [Tropicimonas marinistellae]
MAKGQMLAAGLLACAALGASEFAMAQTPAPPELAEPSDEDKIMAALTGGISGDRWKEGLLFEGVEPMDHMQSASNWFPGTEDVQPEEMRIIFMGTSPIIRPGQMNTSILVQLGNGENYLFDVGEGSVANINASNIALNELDKIFITHLHVDHYNALPYIYVFGGWSGRWHNPLRVFGPSGRTPEYGTAAMIEGMKQMVKWHTDAFSVFPVGQGHDIEVNEFPFDDDGGVVLEENGVKIIHWQRSHAKDGASAYRLDWNGLCFVWTGDGRPNMRDVEYAKGCDVYVTETQTELVEISAGVQGVPPFLARYTIDTHHTPGYAAGYVANLIQPRMFLTTHMPFDPYLNEETVAEIREHWQGPYHFGAPDGIVVNVTKDKIWVREGIIPDYPNNRAPQFNFDNDQLVVPGPPTTREEIQNAGIRESQIDPDLYYPEGYKPELMEDWPTGKEDLVVPYEALPPALQAGMGDTWRKRKALREYHGLE